MPRGRPRKYAERASEGPGKRLSVPDVDWGGRSEDVDFGVANDDVPALTGTGVKSEAAPTPEQLIGPDRDRRQAETDERLRRMIEENPGYLSWERGYN